MPLLEQHIGAALSQPGRLWMILWEQKYMIESGILHVIIPILIVICAVFVARFQDLIYAALALASLSLLLALEFYLLQAPDVAIAEAGVGAAITVAIYILAIRATKRM
jgi:energy-converting hydrogenase B subunit D